MVVLVIFPIFIFVFMSTLLIHVLLLVVIFLAWLHLNNLGSCLPSQPVSIHFILLIHLIILLFLNLISRRSSLHHGGHLARIHTLLAHDDHALHIVGIVLDTTRSTSRKNHSIGAALLHEGLAAIGSREVCHRDVQAVVVLGADEAFALFVGQVLVWVVTRLAKKCHVVLELLDLVQVVNESLGDLLDKKGTISNFELDFLFGTIVALRILAHLLLSDDFGDLSGSFKRSCVAD